MKKLICLLLLTAILLCGCTSQPKPPVAESTDTPTTESTSAPTEPETTEATEPTMSPEEAQAILQERRDIVEAEMRRMMSVLWRPTEDFDYSYLSASAGPAADALTSPGSVRHMKADRIYSGMPYTHGSGSGDSFLSVGEPDENGVYLLEMNTGYLTGTNNTGLYRSARLGNDCADAVSWAWSRVASSIQFDLTTGMTKTGGCLKVGDYVCDDTVTYKNTAKTCLDNGEETMFAAYMQLQKGDGLVMYDGNAGHAIMFVDIHVEYNTDGTINADNSYCLVHEQGGGGDQDGKSYYDEALGATVYRIASTDNKYTFRKLFDKGYLPITIKELVDPSPLPEPVVTDSRTENSIDKIYFGEISSNYRISHVTIDITDANGKVVQSCTCFVREVQKYCFEMKSFRVDSVSEVLYGQFDPDALPEGTYTCTVTCHISTGEKLVARQFDFSK